MERAIQIQSTVIYMLLNGQDLVISHMKNLKTSIKLILRMAKKNGMVGIGSLNKYEEKKI